MKETAEGIGLRFNNKKCEAMCSPDSNIDIEIDGTKIKVTDTFCYLGSTINKHGNATDDIRTRIGKANTAFGKIEKIMRSKQLNLKTKLKIYNATTIPVLLYGSETWQLYSTDAKKRNAFHRNCLRKILGISLLDKVRNEVIMERTGAKDIVSIIQERRLRWFGHVVRMDSDRFPRKVCFWTPTGKRKRGRPKLTWKSSIERDLANVPMTWKDATEAALDRQEWRFITARCALSTGRTKY